MKDSESDPGERKKKAQLKEKFNFIILQRLKEQATKRWKEKKLTKNKRHNNLIKNVQITSSLPPFCSYHLLAKNSVETAPYCSCFHTETKRF